MPAAPLSALADLDTIRQLAGTFTEALAAGDSYTVWKVAPTLAGHAVGLLALVDELRELGNLQAGELERLGERLARGAL